MPSSYVDGGYHITNTQLQRICWTAGVAASGCTVAGITVEIYGIAAVQALNCNKGMIFH